ncbi:hypothetical protein [Streptomyces sp.]|uniref:hypothetical protein n=1 Tax=Streptomyces sp. TaxID=1931 RepID=UPI002F95C060
MITPTPRICRTPDEAFAAGQADAKHHRPLSPAEITRLVALLRPYRDDLLRERKTA